MADHDVKCPECQSPMNLKTTSKYQYDNGDNRKFYGCSQYPKCKGTHGAHPDGKPLGTPADAPTKKLRVDAHRAMDWWMERKGIMNRREGYKRLKEEFGTEIHMGELDSDGCQKVINFCKSN